ncbi:MAG: DUF503 domain-containing protein [Clostridia bacterium]|jgi:uncharacterized protein YlxP (DUF503 family)
MFIASARVEIFIGEAHSLKEKRKIIKSVLQRIKNAFNVSVAEVEAMDRWQVGVLGIACVSGEMAHARQQLDAVLDFLERDSRFELGRVDRELY